MEDARGTQNEEASAQAFGETQSTTIDESMVAADVVQESTVRVLRERISLLGINRSGAYEHYRLMLSRGFPIPIYEIAILDLVRRRFPDLSSYHEIGSGLGTLPFMLAHDGFPAVGIERDEPRHLTAVAILGDLAERAPNVEEHCRLIGAPFPDAVADIDVSNSLAILTDFVSSHSDGEYVRLCQGLARYRYVFLDLQRFCQKRESEEEQQELVEELTRCGLSPCPDQIDLGSEGSYRLFASKAIEQRRKATVQKRGLPSQAKSYLVGRPALAEAPPAALPTQAAAVGLPAQMPAVELPAELPVRVLPPRPQRIKRKRFGGALSLSALLMIAMPTLSGGAYYGFWAADQYVTSFEFAVRNPQAASHSLPGFFGGGGTMSPDAFVVTDFINSHQAVKQVQHDVDLRAMFSRPKGDFWARLNPRVTPEELDAYWKDMVYAHFDVISGNVYVSVRAFTPNDSLTLADAIIKEADAMFGTLSAQAQQDFVRVAEDNLSRAEQRLRGAREALMAFRQKHAVLDPSIVAQSTSAIIDEVRKKLSDVTAQYRATRAISPRSPALPLLRSQIRALESQIASADRSRPSMVARVTTPETLGRYQSLETERQFAEKLYANALKLRQEAYVAAHQRQSYLALFVKPVLPRTSLYPDRPRAIATIFLAAAAAWFVSVLVTYAVRDHLIT